MILAELATPLNLPIEPDRRWAIWGPDAQAFQEKHPAISVITEQMPGQVRPSLSQLDGLLLAGALSVADNQQTARWLKDTLGALKTTASLIVIDWQADGPPTPGPDLGLRFKKGRLCRLLREEGFGKVDTLRHHPYYYMVHAVKGALPSPPYAGEFVDVAGVEELPKNGLKQVELFGQPVVIANTGQEIVAFAPACPHAEGRLDQGLLRKRLIACPRHGYIWNVCTGRPIEPEDEDLLTRYTVRIEPDQQRILVALQPPAE